MTTPSAPRLCEKGEPGTARRVRLELSVVADVGIIGCPNAGKSTLLSAVSNARPKVADYPFTTVVPNLGVVSPHAQGVASGGGGDVWALDDMVLADIPGLLEGAHDGRGLGTAFLRHVARCRILLHLVSGDSRDPAYDFRAINAELELFHPALAAGGDKVHVVLFTKMDLPHVRARWADAAFRRTFLAEVGHRRVAAVSAVTGEGVADVMRKTLRLLSRVPRVPPPLSPAGAPSVPRDKRATAAAAAADVDADADDEEEGRDSAPIRVTRRMREHGSGATHWEVRGGGAKLRRLAAMTNWQYDEAVERFQRALHALGVTQALEAAGVQHGDTVHVGGAEFDYAPERNELLRNARRDGHLA